MVNTLELRNLETYSPEIQTFLREIEKSFLQPRKKQTFWNCSCLLSFIGFLSLNSMTQILLDTLIITIIIPGAKIPVLMTSS